MARKDKQNRRKPQSASMIKAEPVAADDGKSINLPKLFWPVYKCSDDRENEIIEEDGEEFPGIDQLKESICVKKETKW